MANKFGLMFSDVKGNGKLLMIDDNTYTGAVKPLIGTSEPAILSYDANDDVHDSPIMGSRLEMNFWDTETRENLVPYSTVFSQWTTSNILTSNTEDPPFSHINGRNMLTSGDKEEADLLQYAGGSAGCKIGVTLQPNTQYTASVYCKQSGTAPLATIGIENDGFGSLQNSFAFSTKLTSISSGADGGGYKSLGGGWYRIYVTVTTSSVVTNSFVVVNDAFTSAIYWGAQCEEGANPTEFIYTDNAPVDTEYDVFYEGNDRRYLAKIYYEDSTGWNEFWRGYVTKDIYKEQLIDYPYSIKILATDGLAELAGATFDPDEITYKDIGVNYDSIAVTIANALKKTGHSFEIHTLLDLRYKDGLSLKHVFEQDHMNVAKKNWGIWNPKELIQEYMRALNAKIFLANGKWYIISNSAYYDTRVQDASYTTSNSGGTVTGIKASLFSRLTNDENEHLKFVRFNANGVKQSDVTLTDLLIRVPLNLQPLKKDFTKDFLPGIKTMEYKVDAESYNSSTQFTTVNGQDQPGKYLNVNGSFEATNTGTISLYNWTEITQEDFSFQGNNVWLSSGNNAYTSPVVGNNTYVAQFIESTSNNQSPGGDETNFSFKVKPITSASSVQCRWQLKRSDSSGFFTTQYWNEFNKTWTTTLTNNNTVITKDIWNTIKVTIPITTVNQATDIFTFTLYKPAIPTGDSSFKMYLDHVQFEKSGELVPGDSFLRTQTNQVDKYELESKVYVPYGQRSREFQSSNNLIKENFLGRAVSQMILNDRRDYLSIYEGTFYNNDERPVTPLNKIWVNFSAAVLREDLSAIIQKMTYKVKSNTIEMRFYKPNPDDDVSNTFKLRKNV